MNYPIWDIPAFGTGLLMAIVAVVHVYVAHFAIGGGLFLTLTEAKGHRENDQGILDYVRGHAKLFLLISMVFGAVTGVGIWFTISVVHPSATSTLIHSFVFGWATEWVFFVGEIVALFAYVYTFGKLEPKKHMLLGWFYFVFAWLSLFVINGIITVMLTPGEWVNNESFWSGFFNPTMWPSLVFRSLLCFMIAGLFGFLTSTRLKDKDLALKMTRYCVRWLVIPLVLMPAAGYWYLVSVPEGPRALIMGESPEMSPFVRALAAAVPVLLLGGAFMALRAPAVIKKSLAFVLLIVGLLYMGSFEWIREAARRPWIIPGHTYSNGLKPEQIAIMNESGFLKNGKWTESKANDWDNRESAGREIFRGQCQSCHTVGGINNDIIKKTEDYNRNIMEAKLLALGVLDRYMPPFAGTRQEREVLAEYLVDGLRGTMVDSELPAKKPETKPPASPAFDPAKSEYVLFAWRDRSGTINEQLIRRGEGPEIVTEGIKFTMAETDAAGFEIVKAHDEKGRPIAQTIVAPKRSDFACMSCHSNAPGDPLKIHEREKKVEKAGTEACGHCHENLSASVHGWHAVMLAGQGAEACAECHQTDKAQGPMLRGNHASAGLDCTSCHGVMEDHAIALLRNVGDNPRAADLITKLRPRNFESAEEIPPRSPWVQQPDCLNCHVDFKAPQSDTTFGKWTENSTELFSNRSDDAGVMCIACHGDAHATYPAAHPWDSIQPQRLQGDDGPVGGNGNCVACHTARMEDSVHHEGIKPPPLPPEEADAGATE